MYLIFLARTANPGRRSRPKFSKGPKGFYKLLYLYKIIYLVYASTYYPKSVCGGVLKTILK
ncbi:hypothetical protein Hanom_Chr04g00373031 [Helianthus anomalus]